MTVATTFRFIAGLESEVVYLISTSGSAEYSLFEHIFGKLSKGRIKQMAATLLPYSNLQIALSNCTVSLFSNGVFQSVATSGVPKLSPERSDRESGRGVFFQLRMRAETGS